MMMGEATGMSRIFALTLTPISAYQPGTLLVGLFGQSCGHPVVGPTGSYKNFVAFWTILLPISAAEGGTAPPEILKHIKESSGNFKICFHRFWQSSAQWWVLGFSVFCFQNFELLGQSSPTSNSTACHSLTSLKSKRFRSSRLAQGGKAARAVPWGNGTIFCIRKWVRKLVAIEIGQLDLTILMNFWYFWCAALIPFILIANVLFNRDCHVIKKWHEHITMPQVTPTTPQLLGWQQDLQSTHNYRHWK